MTALALAGAISACAAPEPPPQPAPAAAVDTGAVAIPEPTAAAEPSSAVLPAVPHATGPLEVRVVYPAPGAVVDARDSSFIFGSVGRGDATLTINGQPVSVWPNGAWLAWVPLPPGSPMQFELVARAAEDTAAGTSPDSASMTLELLRPLAFVPPPGRLAWIDTTSFAPAGRAWWPRDEYLPLRVRAAPGAVVRLRLRDGTVVPLVATPVREEAPWGVRAFDRDTLNLRLPVRNDVYTGVVRGRSIGADPGPVLGAPEPTSTAARIAATPTPARTSATPTPALRPTPPPATATNQSASDTTGPTLEVIAGADTARARWPLRLRLLDTLPMTARFDDDTARRGGTDSITIGRAIPGGTYTWFFPTGTEAVVTGRLGQDLRVALAPGLHAWVPAADAVPLARGLPAPAAVAGSITIAPARDRVLVRIPMATRVPFEVRTDRDGLDVQLYGVRGDVNWLRYGSDDPLVESVQWRAGPGGTGTVSIELAEPLWGWRSRWDGGDLVLEIRRPPDIDRGDPLRGRLIALDPGHPPGGATGPTGYREAEANLAVALRLRSMLEAQGATVLMTRTDTSSVDLLPRVRMAQAANAELLISIHNNALPDGVNPYSNNGASVYFNHPPSLPLARAIQHALVRRLGVRDLGAGRGDLALVRPTWMPAVLTEGLFMMLPDQEAALRSAEGQTRYARAVYEGIEEFLRSRAEASGR